MHRGRTVVARGAHHHTRTSRARAIYHTARTHRAHPRSLAAHAARCTRACPPTGATRYPPPPPALAPHHSHTPPRGTPTHHTSQGARGTRTAHHVRATCKPSIHVLNRRRQQAAASTGGLAFKPVGSHTVSEYRAIPAFEEAVAQGPTPYPVAARIRARNRSGIAPCGETAARRLYIAAVGRAQAEHPTVAYYSMSRGRWVVLPIRAA